MSSYLRKSTFMLWDEILHTPKPFRMFGSNDNFNSDGIVNCKDGYWMNDYSYVDELAPKYIKPWRLWRWPLTFGDLQTIFLFRIAMANLRKTLTNRFMLWDDILQNVSFQFSAQMTMFVNNNGWIPGTWGDWKRAPLLQNFLPLSRQRRHGWHWVDPRQLWRSTCKVAE